MSRRTKQRPKQIYIWWLKFACTSLCILQSLFCGIPIAEAGSSIAEIKLLSLHQSLVISISKQYRIIDARAAVLKSRSERLGASSAFLPQLSVEDQPQLYRPIGKAGNTYIAGTLVPADKGFFYNSISASFKWNIFSGGKDVAELSAAEDSVVGADQRKVAALATTFAGILQAYTSLAQTQLEIDGEKKIIVEMQRIVHLTKMRFWNGMYSRLKWLKSEQKLLMYQNKLQQSSQKFLSEQRNLLKAMGFDQVIDSRIVVDTRLPILHFTPNKENGVPLLGTPSVKAALANISAARKQVREATAGFWPSLSVVSQYNWLGLNANRPGVAVLDTMGSNYTVGLSVNIPLLPALNVVAAVQSAQAGVVNAMGGYDRAVATVMGRRIQALQGNHYTGKSLAIALRALTLAHESLQLTKARFRNGQGNAISVLKAHVTVLQATDALRRAVLKEKLAKWMALRAYDPARFSRQLFTSTADFEG